MIVTDTNAKSINCHYANITYGNKKMWWADS